MSSYDTSVQDLSVPLNSSSLDKKLGGSRSFTQEDLPPTALYSSKIFLILPLPSSPARRGLFIPHNHRLKATWDVFMSLVLTFSSIESLLYVSYEDHGFAMNDLDPPIWCLFVMDLVITFCTDYRDQDGGIVRSYRRIAGRYLKSWLLIDLIALTPLMFFGHSRLQHYFQLLRILKINRFFRLIDESWVQPLVLSCFASSNSTHTVMVKTVTRFGVTITKQLLVILAFTFFTGAAYYWFATIVAGKVFAEDFVIRNPKVLERPLESWYFAITTLATIGYGDLVPGNAAGRLFVVIMIIGGLGVFTVIIGQYNALINEVHAWRRNDNAVDELSHWVLQCEVAIKRIPERLKTRISAFYEHYWQSDRLGSISVPWWTCHSCSDFTTSPDPVFAQLPRFEQEQVLTLLFGDLFYRYDAFLLPGELRFDLALHLAPRLFQPQEVLGSEGELPKEVLLVTLGLVYCGKGSGNEFSPIISYENRLIIGDLQILMKRPLIATYKAGGKRPVAAFAIPSKPFRAILTQKHPKQLQAILVSANRRLNIVKQAFQSSAAQSSRYSRGLSVTSETEMQANGSILWKSRFSDGPSEADVEEMKEKLRKLKAERRRRKREYWSKRDALIAEISRLVPVPRC